MCDRVLPEAEFAMDAYRTRHNKGPGRCRDCDKEVARARSALSPSQKLGDCADNSAAYEMARVTCQAHAWGSGYYTRSEKSAAVEKVARRQKGENQEGIRGLSAGERRTAEAVMLEDAERRQVQEYRDLDQKAQDRLSEPQEGTSKSRQASEAEQARKDRVKALRQARKDPDWKPEPMRKGS